MTEHADIPITEIHISHNFSYANAATRTAASLLPADIGKIARQIDTEEYWVLTDDSPLTWKILSGGTGLPVTGEIFLTAAGGWPSTTLGCETNQKNEYGTNDIDIYSLDFDQTVNEFAQWSIWMPSDWDGGTITAQFLWTAASGSGDVGFGLQGRSFSDDEAIDQAWGSPITVLDTLLATNDFHFSPITAAILLDGTPAALEFVQLRVYRDAVSDTLTADAKLLGVLVFYTRL